ncbi:MAG: helix-turn-helix domain-containing protein [Bacillota bacterium]|nr:helix-turn-helix domain-containing protein [Bacillota bacterium]
MFSLTELGNRMKEARLAKGLSLDDLQTITKIQKRYLLGIEEGNYTSMPGNFYVRAFIKQYAEAVQLDPEEIFETYSSEIPSALQEVLPEQLSRVKTHKGLNETNSKFLDFLPKILIAIFIIGLFALVYYFLQKNASNNANDPVNKVKAPADYYQSADLTKDKKKPKKIDTVQTNQSKDGAVQTPTTDATKQELTVTQSKGSHSFYELKNADKFEVKVVSKGQTWVNMKNDKGYSFFQGLLKSGLTDSKTIDFSKESAAVIVVGRTVDAEIYVNDQKLEYAVPPANSVRQDITITYVPKVK